MREILHAKWDYVDFERGILSLPDSKTGRKPVYLSATAQAVLSALPKINDNPYIIQGSKVRQPRADLNKPWAAVTKAAGLQGMRIHDFRHSFASVGAGASLGLPIIGKLLGHSQAATADPLRRAVDTIGATISAAMEGNKGGQVVPMALRGGKSQAAKSRRRSHRAHLPVSAVWGHERDFQFKPQDEDWERIEEAYPFLKIEDREPIARLVAEYLRHDSYERYAPFLNDGLDWLDRTGRAAKAFHRAITKLPEPPSPERLGALYAALGLVERHLQHRALPDGLEWHTLQGILLL